MEEVSTEQLEKPSPPSPSEKEEIRSSRHRRILESLVLDGMTPKEVCLHFGLTESRLSILRRSPLWLREEAEMRKEHIETYQYRLHRLLPKAIKVLEDGVENEFSFRTEAGEKITTFNSISTRMDASASILDRGGLVKGGQAAVAIQPTINLYVPTAWGVKENE